jgi:hypothetical protein
VAESTDAFAQFEDNPAVIYVLNSALNIAYCNAAWDEFARRNGGGTLVRNQPIGTNALDVTPTPLLPFYTTLFRTVLRGGQGMDCLYECSSDEIFRRFHMYVTRKEVPGAGPFLVVVNSLVLEKQHDKPKILCDLRILREENGLITMCAHCRRVRLPKVDEGWVWVPDLVRNMPAEASHGICTVCFDIHYGSGQAK